MAKVPKQPKPSNVSKKTKSEASKRWNTSGLLWGLLITLLGVMLLLNNIGVYDFNLGQIWRLWPIIVIGIGVSVLSLKGWLANLVNGALVIATLLLAVYVTTVDPDTTADVSKESVSISSPASTVDGTSEVKIDVGAGTLRLGSNDSADLVDATLESSGFSLKQAEKITGGRQAIELSTEGGPFTWPLSLANFKNDLSVDFTERRGIDLAIDAGAAKIDGDLSGVLLRNLTIDTGASSTDIRLGAKATRLNVSIDTGASSLTLRVPRQAGVRVTFDGGLSGKSLEGLTEVSKGVYESEDYGKAENKIIISADTGASSLKIVRY